MPDQSAPAAGWYLDPHADNTERWWGGTDWTASTRPLNDTPAAAPQTPVAAAPVSAAVTLPPAGWYTDPQNAAGEKWFDGADWTQVTRPGAQPPPGEAGLPGLPGLLGSLCGQVQQGARNPAGFYRGHRQGLDTAAGGAMLVDGLVGLPAPGGNRGGLRNSVKGMVLGVVFVMGALFMLGLMRTPSNMSATADGTVTSVQTVRTSKGSAGCTPTASFVVAGKTYLAALSGSESPCRWGKGQHINVAYDPASPDAATIPTGGPILWLPWVFVVAGAWAFVASLLSFVRSSAEIGAGGFLLMRMWRRRRATTPE